MGGQQAAKTLLDLQLAQLKRQGKEPDDKELSALFDNIKAGYDEALDIRYAAARLWIDEIILPLETRGKYTRLWKSAPTKIIEKRLKWGLSSVVQRSSKRITRQALTIHPRRLMRFNKAKALLR
ncbi:MAG: hypothetical protein R2865_09890 [Deinococcales bacterium]